NTATRSEPLVGRHWDGLIEMFGEDLTLRDSHFAELESFLDNDLEALAATQSAFVSPRSQRLAIGR
ncbi:MAG: hypothetical protein AAGA03_13790, partial [Planctomycetota bacterium]